MLAVGCKDKISPRDYYEPFFNRAVDSISYYECKFKCAKSTEDAGVILRGKYQDFIDSMNKYYALMYPIGNPADKKKANPCDCK